MVCKIANPYICAKIMLQELQCTSNECSAIPRNPATRRKNRSGGHLASGKHYGAAARTIAARSAPLYPAATTNPFPSTGHCSFILLYVDLWRLPCQLQNAREAPGRLAALHRSRRPLHCAPCHRSGRWFVLCLPMEQYIIISDSLAFLDTSICREPGSFREARSFHVREGGCPGRAVSRPLPSGWMAHASAPARMT